MAKMIDINGDRTSALRARLFLSLAFFLDGITFATWVSRIPVVQEKLKLSNRALGCALFMMSIGALVSMPITGRVAARWGSRSTVAFAVGLFGAGLLLPALAIGVITLGCSLLIFGCGFGAINVSANAQAVTVEKAYGKPIMSSFHALFSLGGIAGAGIGSLSLAHHVQLMTHFSTMGLMVIALATLLWKNLLQDHNTVPPAKGGISYSSKLAVLGAIAFCSSLGEGSMADWSAVYLRQVSLATPSIAALGFAAFSLSMTAGRFAADRITLALGSVRLLQAGYGLAAFGMLLAILIPHTWFVIVGFGCVGAGLAALIPTLFRAAGQTAGVSPAVAIATVATTGYFGFLSGAPVIGFASGWISLRWAMLLVFAGCCVGLALARNVAIIAPELTEEPTEKPSDDSAEATPVASVYV